MKLGFRRAVVVGLGGTGVRTLVHIKREFRKHFEGLPPVVRLLGFDTDEASHETLQLGGENIKLDSPEFLKITATKLRSLIDSTPEIKAWVPPQDRMSMRDIVGGAGARRPSGRLALFNRANLVYDTISQAYRSVNDLRNVEFNLGSYECEVVDSEHTSVFIVGSLAGGTGSGMVLDIAHMCRNILEDPSDPIFGFLLLAGVYAHRPATYFVEANTYAALKEIDYFMDTMTPMKVKYPLRRDAILWGGEGHRPFSYIYLMDNENEKKLQVNQIDPMLDFISRSIFLHMSVESGAHGGRMKSYFVNLNAILDALPSWEGKSPRYMGIGLSNLLLPVEEVVDRASTRTVNMLLSNVVLGTSDAEEPAAQDAQRFLDERIRISSFQERLEQSQEALKVTPLEQSEARKKDPAHVHEWKANQQAALRNRCAELSNREGEVFGEVYQAIEQALERQLNEYLRSENAIVRAKTFLEQLLRLMRSERGRLRSEIEVFDGEISAIEYPSAKEVEDAFHGATRRLRLNRVLGRAFERLEHERESSIARAIISTALDILMQIIAGSESRLGEIEQLESTIRKTIEVSQANYRKLQQERPLEDAFTIQLPEEYLDQDVMEIGRLMGPELIRNALDAEERSFERTAEATFMRLAPRDPEDIYDWLYDMVRPRFAEMEEMTIENALSFQGLTGAEARRKEDAVTNVTQRFVDKACPMWTITLPPGRVIEEIFVFGVPYSERGVDDSIVRDLISENRVELRGEGAARPGYHFALTWEKYCVRALKVKAAVPLTALNNVMGRYRSKYIELEKGEGFHYTAHIHKDWIGGKGLPELDEPSCDLPQEGRVE